MSSSSRVEVPPSQNAINTLQTEEERHRLSLRDRSVSRASASGANVEPTSPRSPVAPFPAPYPQQRMSRAPEFYGFVAWMSTSALFVLYVLWALLPDEWIEWCGIDWYPSREWSILLPAYSIVLILLTYFTYWALALHDTPALNDLNTLVDSLGHDPPTNIADVNEQSPNPYLASASPDAIPELYDIPIGLVNRILYES